MDRMHRALITAITAALLCALTACFDASATTLEEEIWNAYINTPGNQSTEYYELDGKVIKKGTVPASAVGSISKQRLPAYMAHFNYIENFNIGGFHKETDMSMYMYYVKHEERGKEYISWGSKEKITEQMRSDGFKDI